MAKEKNNKRRYGTGSILRRGSSRLYAKFPVKDYPVCRSTGILDDEEGWKEAQALLDDIMHDIRKGIYDHAAYFPKAPEEEKRHIAKLMKRHGQVDPADVDICSYINDWIDSGCDGAGVSKANDWRLVLRNRVIPHFEDKTFADFTDYEIQLLVESMKASPGAYGVGMAKKSIINVLTPLRRVWKKAKAEHKWNLPNPFEDIKDHYPKRKRVRLRCRRASRFDAFRKTCELVSLFYQPMIEIITLMGLMPSEAAGIRKTDVKDGFIFIRKGWSRRFGESDLKTGYRLRKFPITKAIAKRLAIVMNRPGEYLFTMEDGSRVDQYEIREKIWAPAVKAAGTEYKVPYAFRHNFITWSLVIGVTPFNIYRISGLANIGMVYENYTQHVPGLMADKVKILNFMGRDYLKFAMEANFDDVEID